MSVKNQTHALDGTILEFSITPPQLDPNLNIAFIYSIRLTNGQQMPTNLISIDTTKLELSTGSEDQSLAGKYEIIVDAASNDPRLSGQTFSTSFNLELFTSLVNTAPEFASLNSTNEIFTFSRTSKALSDRTVVAGRAWSSLKHQAMSDDYLQQDSYLNLLQTEKQLIQDLRRAQSNQGNLHELQAQFSSNGEL